MQSPLVSIMMPAYNAEGYIARAIRSVLAQSYQHWELIIVDDGSTDNTGAVAAEFQDPRILLIRQRNAGEASARNAALSLVKGELIAFLDADDLFLDQHLDTAVQYLMLRPDRAAVFTDGYYCDQNDTRLEKLSARRIPPVEGRIYDHLVRTSSVFGPPVCVVIRRDVVTRHNLRFDPEIVIGPDWDFFIRYADHAEFGFSAAATCLYRVHRENITIRTDSGKRLQDLARCRAKAISMPSFAACSIETRQYVFYDLLINLLVGSPDRQAEAANWPQFRDLPANHRARLLRLLASDALRHGISSVHIADWLRRSRSLDPADVKGALLAAGYHLSPFCCRLLLRAKHAVSQNHGASAPLQNIGKGGSRD